MNEFFLVKFPQKREVIINDEPSGYFTDDVIPIEPGSHSISLAGDHDFSPDEQLITLENTSMFAPQVISFDQGSQDEDDD